MPRGLASGLGAGDVFVETTVPRVLSPRDHAGTPEWQQAHLAARANGFWSIAESQDWVDRAVRGTGNEFILTRSLAMSMTVCHRIVVNPRDSFHYQWMQEQN
jgi:hypothetical protein